LVGDVAMLARDWQGAVASYRPLGEAMAETSTSIRGRRLHLKLAYALRQLGDESAAANSLQTARANLGDLPRFCFMNWTFTPYHALHYTDAEIYALTGEKPQSIEALQKTLAFPDDGLIPIGSLPMRIEDSPLLESLHGEPGFAAFRTEVARRREIMSRRVRETRVQLGLAAP
jgi:hypothetical protein